MFKSIILGGAAAVALTCGGFVASSFAQTQQAPAGAPAATTQSNPSEKPAADESSAAMTTKHMRHHYRSHWARYHSTRQERAETLRLNQDQLARAQGASQGSYGTMEQQQPQPAPAPSNDMNGGPNAAPSSDMSQPTPPPPPPPNAPPPQKP